MRNPSYTKSGPGRRPANTQAACNARWVFDALVQTQLQAQKRRAQKKVGVAYLTLQGTTPYDVSVFHDDAITMRNGKVYVDGIWVY